MAADYHAIHPTSGKRSSTKLARAALVPYHRLYRSRRAYRVCVPMHDLPGVILWAEDHRHPQIERLDTLPSATSFPCRALAEDLVEQPSGASQQGAQAKDQRGRDLPNRGIGDKACRLGAL